MAIASRSFYLVDLSVRPGGAPNSKGKFIKGKFIKEIQSIMRYSISLKAGSDCAYL